MIKGGTVYRPTSKNANLILSLPYITRAPRFSWCDAWTGGSALPRKCPKHAEFKYKTGSTKKAHAPTGYYCWTHLFTHAIFAKVYDKERAERAFTKLVNKKKEKK